MALTYSEFTEHDASRKILLCKLNAAKRLVGWTVYSGSIYKISIEDSQFDGVFESGVAYTEGDLATLMPMQYFYDRRAGIFYLRTTGSVNPNSVFIHCEVTLFFSDRPVSLPYDLNSGRVVEWLPFITRTSGFQFAIDNKETQVGSPIESKSSLSMINDGVYWVERYDKLIFENKRSFLYSYNLDLPITEAKLLFKGTVQSKTYSAEAVSFSLKDPLNELRSPLPQADFTDYSYTNLRYGTVAARMGQSTINSRQRTHYGRPDGVRLISIDEDLKDGNEVNGTFSPVPGTPTVNAVAGTFIDKDLLQNDEVEFAAQPGVFYEVNSILGGGVTTFTLTANYTGPAGTTTMTTKPKRTDGRFNRHYHICEHNLSQPETTLVLALTASFIQVADASFLSLDDKIQVGSGYFGILEILGGIFVRLASSMTILPAPGSIVRRMPIRNLYIGSREIPTTSWGLVAIEKQLFLNPTTNGPEFLITPSSTITGTIATTGTSLINGAGTNFQSELEPGDFISTNAATTLYGRILYIVSDTQLHIDSAPPVVAIPSPRKKAIEEDAWANSENLSVNLIGKPAGDVVTNVELQTGPDIVRDILETAGLTSFINNSSFNDAATKSPHVLGLSIPEETYDESGQPLREIISTVNRSILGVLFQDDEFFYNYGVLSPTRESVTAFTKSDALSFSIESDASSVVKTVRLKYLIKDLDFTTGEGSSEVEIHSSPFGEFLVGTTQELEIESLLVEESSARIFASRWAFLLSLARSLVTIKTKLRGQLLNINDRVEFSHPRMYKRFGSESNSKVGMISNVRRGANLVDFEFDDLSSAFSRVAVISPSDAVNFLEASEDVRFESGYITDPNGLIDNDPNTIGINLIW